jgi:hypothetical protein
MNTMEDEQLDALGEIEETEVEAVWDDVVGVLERKQQKKEDLVRTYRPKTD